MTRIAESTRTCREPSRSLTGRLVAHARAFRADKSGAAAVVAAIVFPVVIGGMGLGAETGYWYLTQRKLQHAADVSAHAGGVRLRAGDSKTAIDAAALNVAASSGMLTSLGTIVVNSPPLTGTKAGNSKSVEVLLTETHARLFSAVFSSTPVTMKARAVSSIVAAPGSTGCVLALAPTASGAVTVSGSTSVALQNCDIASNSNASDSFLMSGSAVLSAGCVSAVGQAVTTAQLTLTQCTAVKVEAPLVRDPYASVAEPSAIGACHNRNVGTPNGSTTLTPTDNQAGGVKSMRFCNGIDLKGTLTFSPGIYIIEGGNMTVNGGDANASSLANLNGSDVTFYFTNGGSLSLNSKAVLSLSAPTSGPFSGILFFGSRTGGATSANVTGSSSSTLQGAIYMPAADIQFRGNSAVSNGCTQVIGRTVTFLGSSSLKSSCATAGTSIISTNETVSVTE